MKSLAMNKLFSKSRTAQDLPKINSDIDLETINKNLLYVTYQTDKILKKILEMNLKQETLDSREFYDQDGTSDNNPDSD